MQTIYKIREKTKNQWKFKVHVITLTDDHPRGGWYRQAKSLNGILTRPVKRWHKKFYLKGDKSVIRFKNYDENYWKINLEYFPYEIEDVIYHNSVWDFYDYIGYNYKDKSVGQIDQLLIISEKDLDS